MPFHFGTTITYNFYVLDPDDDSKFISLSGVTDAPTIYVYDHKPSRADALIGADSPLQTIVAWSDITNGKSFTISPIVDPDTDSGTRDLEYWLAVNTVLEDGEQSQLFLRMLPLQRADIHSKRVTIAEADLEAVFPTLIPGLVSTAQATAAIDLATELTADELSNAGYHWAGIWRADKLQTAITYRTLSNLMISLSTDTGDSYSQRHVVYGDVYRQLIESLKIEFDNNLVGEPTETQSMKSFIRIIR